VLRIYYGLVYPNKFLGKKVLRNLCITMRNTPC
jgi:hypothetical protein